jgi:hypothetical protein
MKYLTLVLALLIGGAVLAQDVKTVIVPNPPANPPKLEEVKTPPQEWLNNLDDYIALARVIQQLKQENGIDKLEAKLNEKGQTLQAQIPVGYTYDAVTKKFKLNNVTPAKPEVPKEKK